MGLTINGSVPKAVTLNSSLVKTIYLNGSKIWPPAWSYIQNTPGIYAVTIPYSCKYALLAYGAAGGSYGSHPGGLGGKVYGEMDLSAGSVLYVCIGGCGSYYSSGDHDGGYNGGGRSFGGGVPNTTGGGCTHVASVNGTLAQIGAANLSKIYMVAGGGGGASDGGAGGAGGGYNGGIGNPGAYGGYTTGGSQSAGGTGAGSNTIYIENGSFGSGGRSVVAYYAGSGGGGLFGGAGGQQSGSGGGGSGYHAGLSNVTIQSGVWGSNGYFSITTI